VIQKRARIKTRRKEKALKLYKSRKKLQMEDFCGYNNLKDALNSILEEKISESPSDSYNP